MLETVETLMKLKMSADDGYYVGKPIMSDAEYDKLKEKIQELLKDDQNLKAKFWEEFKKPSTSRLLENSLGDIRHLFPMTSLDKSNNIDLLMKEIAKWRAHGSNSFVLMWKIDGASGGFRFEEGFLSSTLTRHERDIGKDLTFTGQQILNLPKQINDHRFYEVRGEMLIFADDLEEVNKLRVERGERPYMNARNAAAGIQALEYVNH
jgi:DNA ligase (NAD+)